MLRFLYRNQHHSFTAEKFSSNFPFLQYANLKSFSTITESSKPTDITKDYLINSCGLSLELAIKTSKKILLTCKENPISVLNLFNDYGFSKPQISTVISKYPLILVSDPDNILKPKFEFLQHIGFSGANLTKLISSDPTLLARGLETQYIPSYEYLKSVLGTDEDVRTAFRRCTWALRHNLPKVMGSNVAILRKVGVPDSNISRFLLYTPRALIKNNNRLNEIVDKVKEMGFKPTSMMFIYAVRALTGMTQKNWERKFEVYKELGWTREDTLLMFRKQPACLMVSEKKLKKAVDFFTNMLNLKPAQMSSSPILLLSMEKRIIPRCTVLGVLNSAGVLRKMSVSSALMMSEKKFVEKYVIGYQDSVPDVVKAYEGKIKFAGFSGPTLFREM